MSAQAGEDAILARLFAQIGTTNRVAVEFGARDGVRKSNTHLLRQAGWTCVLLDTAPQAAIVHQAHLTAENLEATFARHHVPATFDLLSIDVDGQDFWLWRALTAYRPRVVVIEYNSSFPPERSIVMPCTPSHRWDKTSYFGASAAALVKLGREKHYTLVEVRRPVNLFFVADEANVWPAAPVPPAESCGHPAPAGRRAWETY